MPPLDTGGLLVYHQGTCQRRRRKLSLGYAHLAFALGSRDTVDALTARLQAGGWAVVSGPRVTGDGYYESCVAGPEGCLLELKA